MIKIVNMTPHEINVILINGGIRTYPRAEIPARLSQTITTVDEMDGINISETVFGEVENLPEPEENTYYIVSRLILSGCPDRKDLLVPNDLVRDSEGNIKGCKGLARN